MPEMDGFQATSAIRSLEITNKSGERIPIVALTANAIEGDRERCLAADMDDYLSKPFTQKQLRQVMLRWLPGGEVEAQRDEIDLVEEVIESQPSAEGETGAGQQVSDMDVLDQRMLDNIRALQQDGAPDMLRKVIEIYFDSADQLVKELGEGVNNSDAEQIRKAAHTLKSSSANVGAVKLAAICKELELMARNNSLGNVKDSFGQIIPEYKRAVDALKKEI